MDSFGVYDASAKWIAAVSLSRSRVYVGAEGALGVMYGVMAES